MKKLIPLFPVFLLLYSCIKQIPRPVEPDFLGDRTVAEGIVLQYGSLEPVSNARVVLRECESEFLGPSYCFELDTFITNETGRYSFDFKHKDSGKGTVNDNASFSYELRVNAKDYFENKSNQLYLKKEYINRDTAFMEPYAWINFQLKNRDPFDEKDEILFGGEINFNSIPEIKGSDIDLNLVVLTLGGNKNIPLSWVVVKNEVRTLFRDTIFVPAFDTVNYQIFY